MLFEGKSFWVAQRVPMRSTWLEQIRDNGGVVVPLEKQADHLIWDHARPKDAPAGTISWTYIEKSVKKGELENPQDHLCGPRIGTQRDVASRQPGKSTREPYTAEDDRVCYKWASEAEERGIQVKGNSIWMQLGALVSTRLLVAWPSSEFMAHHVQKNTFCLNRYTEGSWQHAAQLPA
jgi:hypothetical protein